MKTVKDQLLVWTQLLTFVAIWAVILLSTRGNLTIDLASLKKLPDVVTVYAILAWLFTKWLWKLRIFRGWLVEAPNLHGTWIGEIKSTWVDPKTSETPTPIKVTAVIKQDYYSVSCCIYSSEMESKSTNAQITREAESGVLSLSYVYTSRPKIGVRNRSPIHDGAAMLRFSDTEQYALAGEYWTNRKTTGEVALKNVSSRLVHGFEEGCSLETGENR